MRILDANTVHVTHGPAVAVRYWARARAARSESRGQIEYLEEENRALREQLGERRVRFTNNQCPASPSGSEGALGREGLNEISDLVTPDTLDILLRQYRKLIAKNYDGTQRCGPGRPRVAQTIRELVLRMARENSSWGYMRICAAPRNLEHDVGGNTVKRILAEHDIEPAAPERRERIPGVWF